MARAFSIIKYNDNLPWINGLLNRDICLLVKKCLLKGLDSGTFDNYFFPQKYDKNTCNNDYSIGLPRVKLELARQSFYFHGGKLYNELPIATQKLDAISEFKVILRGHWYSLDILILLLPIHTWISTPIFSRFCFFLNIHCFAIYHFCSLFPFQEPLFAFCYLCPYILSSSWVSILNSLCILPVLYPLLSALTF